MKKYAKFVDEKICILTRHPFRSITTDDTLKEFAEDHEFKELVETDAPNRYYTVSYHETAKRITQTWQPMPLDDAKALALDDVQAELDKRLTTRAVIPCASFAAGIIYDEAALVNALGLALGDMYIDAADNVNEISTLGVDNVRRALK